MMRIVWIVALAACSKHADAPAAPPMASGSAAPPAAAIAAHHEDRHDPAVAAPPLALAVTIDGSAATWQQDVFDRTPHFTSTNNDGQDRDTWSLRELVHAAGANARVTAVIGESRQTIDAAAWAATDTTPIVHRTRRGTLKFRWTDRDGKWGDVAVKEVTGLEVTSK
jgi:hypothetical protein